MCLNLVALTSWKKHICSLNLHQDVRPITQILASTASWATSISAQKNKRIRPKEPLKRLTTNKEAHPNKQFLLLLSQWLCSQGLQPDEPFLMLCSCLDEGQGPYGRCLSRLCNFSGLCPSAAPSKPFKAMLKFCRIPWVFIYTQINFACMIMHIYLHIPLVWYECLIMCCHKQSMQDTRFVFIFVCINTHTRAHCNIHKNMHIQIWSLYCSHITLQPKTGCPLKLSRVEPG